MQRCAISHNFVQFENTSDQQIPIRNPCCFQAVTINNLEFVLQKYRPEDACVDYQYHVLSAIELLDVNNATCKDQYRDLRTGVDDRTLFDYCLESIFVKVR